VSHLSHTVDVLLKYLDSKFLCSCRELEMLFKVRVREAKPIPTFLYFTFLVETKADSVLGIEEES